MSATVVSSMVTLTCTPAIFAVVLTLMGAHTVSSGAPFTVFMCTNVYGCAYNFPSTTTTVQSTRQQAATPFYHSDFATYSGHHFASSPARTSRRNWPILSAQLFARHGSYLSSYVYDRCTYLRPGRQVSIVLYAIRPATPPPLVNRSPDDLIDQIPPA